VLSIVILGKCIQDGTVMLLHSQVIHCLLACCCTNAASIIYFLHCVGLRKNSDDERRSTNVYSLMCGIWKFGRDKTLKRQRERLP
jgi:hypothetical protein